MAARSDLEEEFREFVAARSAALLRTAYLLAGDWATAEDLLQTALTKTYLAWKRLGEIEAVEPYARRVLVNTATSWWRRRWHGERPTEVLPERPAPDQIEEQLERDALWRHVRTLPARQRAVLVLRFYEDMTEAQTAAMLNISPGTVKSQTFRALNTLRRRLGAEAGAEAALGTEAAITARTAAAGPDAARTDPQPPAARSEAPAPAPRRVPAVPRTAPAARLPVPAVPGASAPAGPAARAEGR
ncbi:SigE family RNA polymerase sigma factor [Micromonospora sp. NBC_01796]|uniref:SigE family RNA polymerase sigma factor n=1 Tax=Micromonospora sp. NBC_01796 TaxID=2975987 RepID=UPI002DD902FC|nr:SigE family RNA polymerase sigma factor [Micromonospora sp. NBC_01796]WSA89133.1 SigE family RNA polymerase sigma factor [Micromonospora sp. NBC_01796]